MNANLGRRRLGKLEPNTNTHTHEILESWPERQQGNKEIQVHSDNNFPCTQRVIFIRSSFSGGLVPTLADWFLICVAFIECWIRHCTPGFFSVINSSAIHIIIHRPGHVVSELIIEKDLVGGAGLFARPDVVIQVGIAILAACDGNSLVTYSLD